MRFRDQLITRLETVGVAIPGDEALDKIEAYFELLTRWNRTINLTALPLEKPTDETIDRLFTEALAAVRHLPNSAKQWFDFGSGGGSPAVPMQAVASQIHLTMVESKERKAAFLREVVRNLELSATVANMRFEDVVGLDARSWGDQLRRPGLDIQRLCGARRSGHQYGERPLHATDADARGDDLLARGRA